MRDEIMKSFIPTYALVIVGGLIPWGFADDAVVAAAPAHKAAQTQRGS